MTKRIEIPKGHQVICVFPAEEDYRHGIKSKGCTYSEYDGKLFVQGFIVGDDPKKGLECVALENVRWCLFKTFPKGRENKLSRCVRRGARKGYVDLWLYEDDTKGESSFHVNPTCAY